MKNGREVAGDTLKVGDGVWDWKREEGSTITGFIPYQGPFESAYPLGARVALFSDKTSMVIDNGDYYHIFST